MLIATLVYLVTVFVAFANGANDNFKGVATLHGSGTVRYWPGLAWATVTTLAGSILSVVLARALIARFVGRDLVGEAVAADPGFLLSVAAATAGTVLLATHLGLPISTTHALVGGLVGAGAVLAGPSHLSYLTLGRSFALPLLFSPVLSMLLAAAAYFVVRAIRQRTRAELPPAAEPGPHRLMDGLHVLSGGAVGFARGLNDTPKIVALLVMAPVLGRGGNTYIVAGIMALGGLIGARHVARTLSHEITGMDHAEGFTANLVTAALVTLASPFGLPVSTTHVACGSLFGIGAVNGEARWNVVGRILLAWVTTLPIAALLAALAAGLRVVIAS